MDFKKLLYKFCYLILLLIAIFVGGYIYSGTINPALWNNDARTTVGLILMIGAYGIIAYAGEDD